MQDYSHPRACNICRYRTDIPNSDVHINIPALFGILSANPNAALCHFPKEIWSLACLRLPCTGRSANLPSTNNVPIRSRDDEDCSSSDGNIPATAGFMSSLLCCFLITLATRQPLVDDPQPKITRSELSLRSARVTAFLCSAFSPSSFIR